METAIIILALFFVAFVVLGAYVTVRAVGAAKRGVDRTVAQARRTVEDTSLRARQLTQPGVLGHLADLRLSLRTSMRATQDALRAASPEDTSLSEAAALFRRLSAHGHELDEELRRLEREPDKGRIAERLPQLRERTRQVVGHADSLRWAAQDRARRFADDDLAALGAQIDLEADALRHWTAGADRTAGAERTAGADRTAAERTAAERTAGAERTADGGVAAARGAAASGKEPGAPVPDWPDVSQPGAEAQQPPPAITARDSFRATRGPFAEGTAGAAGAVGAAGAKDAAREQARRAAEAWRTANPWRKATRRPEGTG